MIEFRSVMSSTVGKQQGALVPRSVRALCSSPEEMWGSAHSKIQAGKTYVAMCRRYSQSAFSLGPKLRLKFWPKLGEGWESKRRSNCNG